MGKVFDYRSILTDLSYKYNCIGLTDGEIERYNKLIDWDINSRNDLKDGE